MTLHRRCALKLPKAALVGRRWSATALSFSKTRQVNSRMRTNAILIYYVTLKDAITTPVRSRRGGMIMKAMMKSISAAAL